MSYRVCVYVCVFWCPTFCPIIYLYVPSSVLWGLLRFLYKNDFRLFVEGFMSYLRYLCLFAHSGFQHIFTIWVIWRVSFGKQRMFAIRVPFGGIRVAHLFWFSVLCLLICLSLSCVLCSQCCQLLWIIHSWLPLWFSLTFIYGPKSPL